MIHIQRYAIIFLDQLDSIINDSQGTKSQEIHLQKPQFLDRRHDELGRDRTVSATR